jgi:hypothetical protein
MMRSILLALLATAIAMALCGGSIAGGDRDVLVSPPESVVEDFTRAVVTGRYKPALQHLSANSSGGESRVRELREELHARVGSVHTIEGLPLFHDRDRASGTATVEGDSGTADLQMSLRFEHQEWKIDRWSLPE